VCRIQVFGGAKDFGQRQPEQNSTSSSSREALVYEVPNSQNKEVLFLTLRSERLLDGRRDEYMSKGIRALPKRAAKARQ
jgi:hypothetical protein